MTYTQSEDTDEAYRVWTERIPGNILIGEYSDGDFLIYNEFEEPWHSLILEPPQMQALLDFSDAVETSGDASLGENCLTGQLTVRYQDGAYTFDPEEEDISPTLSKKQIDAIHSLLERMEYIMQEYDKLMEIQERRPQ